MDNFKVNLEKWYFHNNEKDCDYLFNLVKTKVKTATSYLYIKKEDLNLTTKYSILTNWDESEEILLKTTKIYKTKFKDITKIHAFKEGEGDKTLSYYKKVHEEFFKKECDKLNIKFDKNTEIVCEEFEIVNNKKIS